MGINWNETDRTISIQTKSSTYQMKIDEYGYVLHTYYGKHIDAPGDLSYLVSYMDRGFSGNPYEAGNNRGYSLDVLPQEYSCFGTGDYRINALKIRYADGSLATKLHYKEHIIHAGKYQISGLPAIYADQEEAETLELRLEDEEAKVAVCLRYGVIEARDAITRTVTVTNHGPREIVLEKVMSTQLDFIRGSFDLMTFYGRHNMERMVSRAALHHGIQSIGSARGVSSHQYNPTMILCDQKATEDVGNCYGVALVYSGDFLGEAEYDCINQTRIQMGIGTQNFNYSLSPGECFDAPEAVMIYSDQGLSGMTSQYHKLFRQHLCRGEYHLGQRPVLINNWEGTYFDFTGEKLLTIAREAAGLGIELFVMDDGWFGSRDNDCSGLGDWEVNEKKLGCTLQELGEAVEKEGMKFGIWFEPECISQDSNLYRAHPEWALQIPGRNPNRSRFQLVLDFSREDVREYIYRHICHVLDHAPVTYVKWDFNRSICDIYSEAVPAERQKETAHRYILGLYDMLEKLHGRYPYILFEGCSGGGGRFDAGMLYYTPQIWCSDDTDPIERLKIQYGTSFFYPVNTMGAHVSASPNHQTGRFVPLSTRGVVAMSGTFGYELDVNKLPPEEKEEITRQVNTFRQLSRILQYGDYFRLAGPYDNELYTVWEQVSTDKTKAVVNIVSTKVQANGIPVAVKLKGLLPHAIYKVKDQYYTGEMLMNAGLLLPMPQAEYQAWQYLLEMM